ncbi:hypothetical protein OAF71_01705 [bacterium]|nr:hypothetical protein [bacterium]
MFFQETNSLFAKDLIRKEKMIIVPIKKTNIVAGSLLLLAGVGLISVPYWLSLLGDFGRQMAEVEIYGLISGVLLMCLSVWQLFGWVNLIVDDKQSLLIKERGVLLLRLRKKYALAKVKEIVINFSKPYGNEVEGSHNSGRFTAFIDCGADLIRLKSINPVTYPADRILCQKLSETLQVPFYDRVEEIGGHLKKRRPPIESR